MAQEKLIKKIEELRDNYTFETDRAGADSLIKRVRALVLKKEIAKNPVIKDLLSRLTAEVEAITRFMAWDETAKDEVRKEKYIKRDAYLFLLQFFGDPEKELINIEKKVEGDLGNLKEE